MQELAPHVFVEEVFPNVGMVVTEEGVVMIDAPANPAVAQEWSRRVAHYGPLRYLIQTDHHGDHTSSNAWFDTTVVGHELTREKKLANRGVHWRRQPGDRSRPQPPTLTFSEEATIYLGGFTFHLFRR